jgi:phospholipid-translocating ATPase
VEYIGVGDGRKNDESQVALDEDGDNLDESQDNSYVHEKEDVEEVDAPPATWKEKIKRAACACRKRKVYYSRTIELQLGKANVVTDETKLAQNVIRNQKYNPWTFLPVILYEQFKFFFNLYFLLVALSQFIPVLKIGYLFTYVSPLVFVLLVTIAKEAYDDYKRYKRDKEANSQMYEKLTLGGFVSIPSSDIQVGDLVRVNTNQRVPADLLLLKTSEKAGASFIRTDQLDGETDWKLRRAVPSCHKLPSDDSLLKIRASVYAEKPKKDIYNFIGNFTRFYGDNKQQVEPVSVENTMWMNTVVASGTVIGLAIYTGADTRSVMNTSQPQTKVGLLDQELNKLSKVLFGLLVVLAFLLVALNKFHGAWFIIFFRFVLLFSSIIPISLRVNLDMGKTLYSWWIMRDNKIAGTIVRTSTIPEELGRISYLMSDKTGTLTQNEMIFKRLNLGSIAFTDNTLDELESNMESAYTGRENSGIFVDNKQRRSASQRTLSAITAIALAHNVTPNMDEHGKLEYQASSPDEVALVKFTESVGMTLYKRSLHTMTLKNPIGEFLDYEILNVFPFTSETKRMGIIVKDTKTNTITFYMKGADAVMARIVQANDWLEEECGNMAREGLRTLVFGKKDLTEEDYENFSARLTKAKTTIQNRAANVQAVIETLEENLELIGLTGVEDKLQPGVQQTLEMLRNAGLKIWMLTGDKIETATCIAISAGLISKKQDIHSFVIKEKQEAYTQLNIFASKKDCCLIIDGNSLQICLDHYRDMFAKISCKAPAVVCCRCSPTQKAEIVKLIKNYTQKQTAAIGDGGNDVSMIQAADVGLGIVGKEGKQASLAADFSILQFSYISRLMLWHGRNSYKRSARLGNFVIHRGLIISVIQAIFSSIFFFVAVAVYNGWLVVGYSLWYTMFPVFSLVLDEDIDEDKAFKYPELYQELQKGRALSYKSFFIWVFQSIYQGGVIMLLAIFLFEDSFLNIVSITFTTLILTELLNVAFEVHKWHLVMIISEVATIIIYVVSMIVLRSYFDISFITSWGFVWRVFVITAISCLPVYLGKLIKRKLDPPAYAKL